VKKTSSRMILGVSLLLAIPLTCAASKTLNIHLITQEHSEWCWAGASKAVLSFYKKTPSQCRIVNWAFGINYACGNNYFNWNSQANQPNSMYGDNGSVQDILNAWGVPNTALSNYLSWAHVVSDIGANRPFVMRYGWTNGGGHIVVGRGYETVNGVNYLYIMNPWPGEGMTYGTYDSTVSDYDHQWTNTQRMNISG
jgi:Peptidase_C39 like family